MVTAQEIIDEVGNKNKFRRKTIKEIGIPFGTIKKMSREEIND